MTERAHHFEHVTGIRVDELFDDQPVRQEQDPVGDRCCPGIVRDHHDRLAVGVRGASQQIEDLAAGLRIEVSGGLIGEQDRWPAHECACDRDALLLTA